MNCEMRMFAAAISLSSPLGLDIPMSDFGSYLKEARERKGWEQEKLAEEIDTSQGNISMYERGERKPRRDRITRIAAVLGVDASEALLAAGYAPKAGDNPKPRVLKFRAASGEEIEIRMKEQEAETMTEEKRAALHGSVETSIALWRRMFGMDNELGGERAN